MPRAAGVERADAVVVRAQDPRPMTEFGPELLLPDPGRGDDEVARVGGQVLRRSHAFARLLSADPRLALSAVDLLVFDVLVAGHAREAGIRVEPARVHALAEQEEATLREQVAAELGAGLSFDDYVWRTFGMTIGDWRQTVQLRVAQRLYHGYVIRYLAMREERVTVRYIVHKDPAVLRDLAERVRDGADFGTLALRHSEDALRRDGGLLPPFGAGFPHPVAEVALALRPGDLSAVFQRDTQNGTRHYLVYCLDRTPGRAVAFADVRDEIDADLQQRPLTPIETNAYTLRWRGALEQPATPVGEERHDKAASDR